MAIEFIYGHSREREREKSGAAYIYSFIIHFTSNNIADIICCREHIQ